MLGLHFWGISTCSALFAKSIEHSHILVFRNTLDETHSIELLIPFCSTSLHMMMPMLVLYLFYIEVGVSLVDPLPHLLV